MGSVGVAPTGGEVEAADLRCYAVRSGTGWEAFCVNYDLAVSGESLAAVRSSLATAVELYLEEVADAEPDVRRYLLSRRSPWFVRGRLALLARVRVPRGASGGCEKLRLRIERSAP